VLRIQVGDSVHVEGLDPDPEWTRIILQRAKKRVSNPHWFKIRIRIQHFF